MPSIDPDTMADLLVSDTVTIFAEQNNGMIWNELGKMLLRTGMKIRTDRVIGINTTCENGEARFLHSAPYNQLLHRYGLSPEQIVERVRAVIGGS